MTTYAPMQERKSVAGPVVFLLALALAVGMGIYNLNAHAIEKHGISETSQTINCLESKGPGFILDNPDTGRRVMGCEDETNPKTWFIFICVIVCGSCVTAYKFKEGRKYQRWEVEDHFKKRGFKNRR